MLECKFVKSLFFLCFRVTYGVIHMSISQRADKFWVLGEFSAPFQSIAEMVDYYSTQKLKISDNKFEFLRFAVDRSHF